MIELAKHIEILLLDNDCVIVPGFGGFMAHHVDAVIDEEGKQFLPPSRTLGFNPQLHINDSLLAQSYVEAYDISYPDALKRIEAEVIEMRQTINNEGYFELPDIGVIHLNDDGNMEFEPCVSGILTPSLYALSLFEMKVLPDMKSQFETIKVETVQKPVVEQAEIEKETDTEAEIVNEPFIQSEYDECGEETAKVISIKVSTLKKIAAVALVLIIVGFAAFPFSDNIKSHFVESKVDTSLLTKVMPKVQETTPKSLDTVKSEEQKTVSNNANLNKVDQSENSKEKKGYVIVLASRVSKHNAEGYVALLQKEGIADARIIEKGKGNKVVCGTYSSESEAREGAQKLRNQSNDFKDVWVMHIKD